MKVHLIKKQTLEEFAQQHPRSKTSLEDWVEKLKFADWEQPGDMKETFNTADLLGKSSNRVIFDIGGNNFRMICKYVFGAKQAHLFVAGWERMPSTTRFASKVNSTQLISIDHGNYCY